MAMSNKKRKKTPGNKTWGLWLRGQDLNLRPSGYERWLAITNRPVEPFFGGVCWEFWQDITHIGVPIPLEDTRFWVRKWVRKWVTAKSGSKNGSTPAAQNLRRYKQRKGKSESPRCQRQCGGYFFLLQQRVY